MKLHPALALYAVGPVAAILHENTWAGRLPERVATHFGSNGMPNGWMSRDGATTSYIAVVIGLNVLFAVISLSLGSLPASMINIPNREYWLAPEHRDETVRKMTLRMAIFSLACSAFLITVFEMSFEAAVQPEPRLPMSAVVPALCTFLVFVAAWVGALLVAFRKPA